MSELTRRGFVRSSAGAAAGIAAVGAFGVTDADGKKQATHSHPVIAWLGDPRDGTITIMSGDGEVTIHDHALAAKIARHAKDAKPAKHTTRKVKHKKTRK
jgi:hypothetical protein